MAVELRDEDYAKIREAIFAATDPYDADKVKEIAVLLHRARAAMERIDKEAARRARAQR